MDPEPDDQLVPRWRSPGVANEIYDVSKAAMLAGITSRAFLKYHQLGLYQPLGDKHRLGYQFDWEAVYLARQAENVREELAVDFKAAILIVKLKREVELLREELDFWRR